VSTLVPDRVLRRMIVDLAALPAEEIEAVLAELDPQQRARVERLVQEFLGFGFVEPAAVEEKKAFDKTAFSPWLLQRLDSADTEFRLTERARAALQDAALELYPVRGKVRAAERRRFGRRSSVRGGAAA